MRSILYKTDKINKTSVRVIDERLKESSGKISIILIVDSIKDSSFDLEIYSGKILKCSNLVECSWRKIFAPVNSFLVSLKKKRIGVHLLWSITEEGLEVKTFDSNFLEGKISFNIQINFPLKDSPKILPLIQSDSKRSQDVQPSSQTPPVSPFVLEAKPFDSPNLQSQDNLEAKRLDLSDLEAKRLSSSLTDSPVIVPQLDLSSLDDLSKKIEEVPIKLVEEIVTGISKEIDSKITPIHYDFRLSSEEKDVVISDDLDKSIDIFLPPAKSNPLHIFSISNESLYTVTIISDEDEQILLASKQKIILKSDGVEWKEEL